MIDGSMGRPRLTLRGRLAEHHGAEQRWISPEKSFVRRSLTRDFLERNDFARLALCPVGNAREKTRQRQREPSRRVAPPQLLPLRRRLGVPIIDIAAVTEGR